MLNFWPAFRERRQPQLWTAAFPTVCVAGPTAADELLQFLQAFHSKYSFLSTQLEMIQQALHSYTQTGQEICGKCCSLPIAIFTESRPTKGYNLCSGPAAAKIT